LEDGAVLVTGNRVAGIDRWSVMRALAGVETMDLGDMVLLPGLINAHCHLDYTNMAGQINPPAWFSDWIKALLALKAHWTYSDFSLSWLRGARMLLSHGTTTVVDIEAVPELLPEVLTATPLRVCTLLEMTGVRSRRPAEAILQEVLDQIQAIPPNLNWAGLSPHAPYSTSPELLRRSAEVARLPQWPLATHVAESREEFDMFSHGTGAMFEWLKSQRDMSDCGQGSPLAHLDKQGMLGENFLAVHANYLAEGDVGRLSRSRSSVVHCPRSHAYFGHHPFPLAELARAGVNICLGTDSLASVRVNPGTETVLDLFSEMRQFAGHKSKPSAESLVQMVTTNAARALRRAGQLGQISKGSLADLIAIPFHGSGAKVYDAVVAHAGPVSGVMIDGRWVVHPRSND
jgi:cytosine/adenosine deaminase-related metal-dependent hydrolase